MNNSRAEIMAALQKASSLSEQIALVSELEALDAREASNVADSRSLDFTSSIVDQTLSPVLVHEFHTASTDWLSMDDDNDDAGYHKTVMAKAAVWYGKVSPEVKADGAEFVEQARGIARRTASSYGTFAADAEATFLSYVAFLNREAASGLDQIDQSIDPNNMPKPTEYPAATFPTFQDPVHPINEQAFGQEGQWNNPLLAEIEQIGQGEGVGEWPAIPGGGTANSTNVTSVAISHSYNLDEFRQREAASTLDQITQTTAPDGVTFKPTPLPADVAYPWILGGPVVDPEADDQDFTQAAPAAIDKAVAARRAASCAACDDSRKTKGGNGYCDKHLNQRDQWEKRLSTQPIERVTEPRIDPDVEKKITGSRRTAAPADISCRSCDATGKTKNGKNSCGNCGGMGIVSAEVNAPKNAARRIASGDYLYACTSCDASGKNEDGKNSCGKCRGAGFISNYEVNAPKNAYRRTAGLDDIVGRTDRNGDPNCLHCAYDKDSAEHFEGSQPILRKDLENHAVEAEDHNGYILGMYYPLCANCGDDIQEAADKAFKLRAPRKTPGYKTTSSRKTADMYGNSDMPHAVPQPNVANSPATTPQPQQGGSYSAGFAAGMADATVGDAPTYSDNSSGLEFSQGYVEGYSKGFDVVKSKVQKDQPYSAGGDNGQALRSGTARRKTADNVRVVPAQTDSPFGSVPTPTSPKSTRWEQNEADSRWSKEEETNGGRDPHNTGNASRGDGFPLSRQLQQRDNHKKDPSDDSAWQDWQSQGKPADPTSRTSSLFTPEEAFEIADFRKAYKFASKWNAGKPLVRTGSAEFEAGLYAGISDNPAAQDAWVAKHRKQASKFPEFGERIALHKDFSVKMLDSTDAMVKSAYLVQAATSTDLDTMAPSASPSPAGETPINGPGRPGPNAGGTDPARPGGPAPYNGVEPFGQSVINDGISTATPATNKISEARKLATFRNAVQGGLSALAAYPQDNDKVMRELQEKHDNDDGLNEDDEKKWGRNRFYSDTVEEWHGEK